MLIPCFTTDSMRARSTGTRALGQYRDCLYGASEVGPIILTVLSLIHSCPSMLGSAARHLEYRSPARHMRNQSTPAFPCSHLHPSAISRVRSCQTVSVCTEYTETLKASAVPGAR